MLTTPAEKSEKLQKIIITKILNTKKIKDQTQL